MNSASEATLPSEARQVSVWRRLYEGWLAIAGRFGQVQTQVVLTLVYVLVMGPFAIAIAAARGDLLDKRDVARDDSAWCEADSAAPDLERAKRLF